MVQSGKDVLFVEVTLRCISCSKLEAISLFMAFVLVFIIWYNVYTGSL